MVTDLCVLTHLRDHLQAMGGHVIKGACVLPDVHTVHNASCLKM